MTLIPPNESQAKYIWDMGITTNRLKKAINLPRGHNLRPSTYRQKQNEMTAQCIRNEMEQIFDLQRINNGQPQ
jgi:hypothetical protein